MTLSSIGDALTKAATSSRLPQASARSAWLVDVFAIAMFVIALAFVLTTVVLSPWKDDVAWLLWVARKWLDGRDLYVDLVEVNPPLVIWLYAIPAAISYSLSLAPKLVATLFFAGILIGSAWWTACLLQGRAPLFGRRAPVFSVVATLLLVLPGVEFGQREHLLAAAVLPYIALFVRSLEGEKEPLVAASFAGAFAALGCAMKPSYGLALVIVEAIGVMRGHKQIRLAPLAFIGTTGFYGVGVLVFEPDFLTRAVPLALALYGGTDTSVWHILTESRNLLFGQAVTLVLCAYSQSMLGQQSPFLRHLYLALVAFAVACTVLFVMQGKDWFYHRLPATTATVLALILWLSVFLRLQLGQAAQDAPNLTWRRVTAPAGLAVAALFAFGFANVQRLHPWVEAAALPSMSTEAKLVKLIKREKAKTYIAFSEWIALGFPVVNDSGVSWASRFDSMWALKGEIWKTHQDGRAPKEWPIHRWVARDFVAGCPDIAVVDTREGTNYIGVLVASDEEFARAWSHYREIAAFDGLKVFKREELGCAGEPLPPGRPPQTAVVPSE